MSNYRFLNQECSDERCKGAIISVTLYNIYFTKRVNPNGIQWNFTLIYLNNNAIIFTYKHKFGFCRKQRHNYNVSKFKYCVGNFELISLLWSFSNEIKLIMSHHKYGILFGPQAIIWRGFLLRIN